VSGVGPKNNFKF